jgi:hypothetical protein
MCKYRKKGLCDAALGATIFAAGVWLILSGVIDLIKLKAGR